MKNRVLGGKVYSSLIRTLFYQTLATLGISGLIAILLRTVFRRKLANILTNIICVLWKVEWDEGIKIYQSYIRNNLYLIVIVVILIIFFILFRLSLTLFTRYFDQIVTGIDQLSEEADEKIVMSSKLEFIETKLNEAKQKLKNRGREAKAAEQRKNELVMYLAHDIKTPLTSVIGYLSLLDEATDMPIEQKAKYVHIALEKAYRLETLINEFFEITRYNLQNVPLNKANINLCYMMVQITDEFYPLLSANGKEVALNIPEELCLIADSDKIARVFNNILKNAIAYGTHNSVIHISAGENSKTVAIRFENEGEIPRDKLDSIFEKFYRLDDSRSTSTGGAGLGLAIAKDIVTLHGGTIVVESNHGHTTFIIELPKQL